MCSRCAELEERIAWLEGELGLRDDAEALSRFRSTWGITPAEAQLLMHLHGARGKLVTNGLLEDALPKADHAAERQFHIVKVYVARLRQKLGSGVIETVWGHGYRLTDAGMAKVGAALSPREIAA